MFRFKLAAAMSLITAMNFPHLAHFQHFAEGPMKEESFAHGTNEGEELSKEQADHLHGLKKNRRRRTRGKLD